MSQRVEGYVGLPISSSILARHGDLRGLDPIFDSHFGTISATDFIGGRGRITSACGNAHMCTHAEDEQRGSWRRRRRRKSVKRKRVINKTYAQ